MIFLERIFPHAVRHICLKWLWLSIILAITLLALGYLFEFSSLLVPILPAAGLALFSFLLATYLLEFFYRSNYAKKEVLLFEEELLAAEAKGAYDLLDLFLGSRFGLRVRERLGITRGMVTEFLGERKQRGARLMGPAFSLALIASHKDFLAFLAHFAVGPSDLKEVYAWIARDLEEEKTREFWWTRESLGRVPGLAKDWAYGVTPTLDKFSRDLGEAESAPSDRLHLVFKKSLYQLESILLRPAGAHVLLAVDTGLSSLDLPLLLAAEVREGRVLPYLEGKRVLLLEQSLLLSAKESQSELEKSLLLILNEAARAGNVILVVDNLSSCIDAVGSLGVDLVALLEPYFGLKNFSIIATADSRIYESRLRKNGSLSRNFETLIVKEPDPAEEMEMLSDMASHLKLKNKVTFTYPALKEITKSAEAYFAEEYALDKTFDILWLLAARVSSGGLDTVGRKEVHDFMAEKTGVPLGELSQTEKETLLNLEELMHKRIVGQKEAVASIAGALRRLRAGVRNPNRPIGTFLFLGPTGVGKTETAKALAEVYFGSERNLMRLDMAEYQRPDSLNRLMTGLSGLLNENPYGVLLLDEFEKASGDILNLFLSILDEGFFSDLDGKRVNARNIIFIATSNAASDIIFEAVESGKELAGMKADIIGKLVSGNIYRAELLNRFDGLILFHPLGSAELRQIAKLMLEKFAKRLAEEKGISLDIDDYLIDKVVAEGADRAFGARPMNRFIQEKIEEMVAKKIIAGEITAGSHLKIDML